MLKSLDEQSWNLLLDRIADKRCTPFLGAGVSPHPQAAQIARLWADEWKYPMPDSDDLGHVSQFLAVKSRDGMMPKEKLLKIFRDTSKPDFDDPTEPHGLLADLNLPLYLTTNYDNFMYQALRSRNRDPSQIVCRWNDSVPKPTSLREPTPASPWVFHLHGSDLVTESLVLTDDDYLDFLLTSSRDKRLLPHQVSRALADTSLLFLGYRLADWSFRVLFRGLIYAVPEARRRLNIAVQLPSPHSAECDYLEAYFSNMKVQVYWGNATDFVKELRRRWDDAYGK